MLGLPRSMSWATFYGMRAQIGQSAMDGKAEQSCFSDSVMEVHLRPVAYRSCVMTIDGDGGPRYNDAVSG